jgi:hypothetical protein
MKYILVIVLILGLNVSADYVKKTVAVCADAKTVEELHQYAQVHATDKDGLELELWLMSHNCKIIDKNTKIKVLEYTGKYKGVLKIKLKKTGEVVYGLNKGIQIEQPGQKNIILKF